MTDYSLHPIGYIRCTVRALDEAPRQGREGAPDAWLEIDARFADPLGLHPVTVREIVGTRLRIGPLEAIDGTPVVDIKSGD